METIFGASQLNSALEQSKSMVDKITDTFLSGRSIVAFIVAFIIATILGRLVAAILRRFVHALSRRADKTQDLKEVNRLRRVETLTILAIALVKMILFVSAVYFWWVFSHPKEQPTALIGASAVIVVTMGATIGPILRDLAYGGVMMAEHWFAVGDYVSLEPFSKVEGIVDRVTLRSTRIRNLNGELIWVNNQNIQGVRVSPKGVRTLAIEVFVSDLEGGLRMIEDTNLRLPQSPLMLVRPLQVVSEKEVAPDLWHITAVGETAPGREWLLEQHAVDIMKEAEEKRKKKLLCAPPVARYADREADRRFARTIHNARKLPAQRKRLLSPEEFAKQLVSAKPLTRGHTPGKKPKKRVIQ